MTAHILVVDDEPDLKALIVQRRGRQIAKAFDLGEHLARSFGTMEFFAARVQRALYTERADP